MQTKVQRKQKPSFSRRSSTGGKSKEKQKNHFRPQIDPSLKKVLARIGRPHPRPFVPDAFQLRALEAIQKTDCLVIAPTGSGKTWIAREAITSVIEKGGRAWYASPLKALSNSKWVEFGLHFDPENVGIITGDTKENTQAPIIVGTTEILRNQLYDAMHQGADLPCDLVILDEAHFLGDADRGVVWEEIMIYLPARIHLLLLSATIGNGEEIAGWLETIRRKECVVIREERRPVPLYPLFLHPSGCLYPFLEGNQVAGAVADYIRSKNEKKWRGGKMPDYAGMIRLLEKFNLLPAIFFLKSRAECDAALKVRGMLPPLSSDGEFDRCLNELLERFPSLVHHRQLKALRTAGIAAHHGGQLPAWKMLVEEMMNRGHLRVIFATSTIAAGVNFPARTIVLFNSDLFNGNDFDPLSATEFRQMTGRAGRRGQDKIGFLLTVPGRFMDLNHIRRLLFKEPEHIFSRLKNDFAMVLNLLLSQTPEDIRHIFERSFAAYQQSLRHREAAGSAAQSLWKDFLRHMQFLQQEGFVEKAGRLTEDGRWASKLRLDYPLLVAQCLREGVLSPEDEKVLAGIIAVFAYDRESEIHLTGKDYPPPLRLALRRAIHAVKPLMRRMEDAGFQVAKLHPAAAAAVFAWARGHSWDSVVRLSGIAEGDMATLLLRTADNLRQIASLKDVYPEIAECALKAREAILREPVLFI
ncbi:MAG TPA: DEAD/DEAH box helicase [Smithella sp.]|nr:DEAD/DEAH box helicase [Smithella sp.]